MLQAVLQPGGDAATALYIVAFSLFIIGIKRGTHPTTAKQGNLVAAVGMAVAVVTTLLLDGMGNWGLIALGLGDRHRGRRDRLGPRADDRDAADGRPLQRRRRRRRGADRLVGDPPRDQVDSARCPIPLDTLIPILFAAVVGSVSFWGSNIAFAKLQDLIPTRPLAVPGQQVINARPADRDRRRLRQHRRQQRRSLAADLHRDPDRRRRCSATSSCCRSAAPTCRS